MDFDKCGTCGMKLVFVGEPGQGRKLAHENGTEPCAPPVPFVPGVVQGHVEERVGCLQHGDVDCERCGKLAIRHALHVEAYEERQSPALGGVLVGCVTMVMMILALGSIGYSLMHIFGWRP